MVYLPFVPAPQELNSTNRAWTVEEVEERHKSLLTHPVEQLHLLDGRGLTIQSIKRFKIGLFEPGVYTIPVYDANSALMAVRYYRKSDHRKWGVKGVTTKMLYPLLGMNGANPLWICEGEFDCMMLLQNGVHAITTTAGAPSTPATLKEQHDYFGDWRRFVLCFDNDETGYEAAAKIGLNIFAGRIDGIVRWPVDFKKDVSDWFNAHRTSAELEKLVVPFVPAWAEQIVLAAKEWTEAHQKAAGNADALAQLWPVHSQSRWRKLVAACGEPNPPHLWGGLIEIGEGGAGAAGVHDHDELTQALKQNEPGETADEDSEKIDPLSVWPTHGILCDYLAYSRFLDGYAPLQYHIGATIAMFAAAIERKTYILYGRPKFTNAYVINIGPSGSGKTSTLQTADRILKRYEKSCNSQLMLPQEMSGEKLVAILAERQRGIFVYSECGTLLDVLRRSYSDSVYTMLLHLYDGASYQRVTFKDGLVVISEPYINILAACTPSLFNEKITRDDIQSGFLPRFLIFATDKPGPDTPPNDLDPTQEAILVHALAATVAALPPRYTLAKDARARYEQWSSGWRERINDGDARSFFDRLADYCLKFSLMFSSQAADGHDVIQTDDIERASILTDWIIAQELAFTCGEGSFSSPKMIKKERYVIDALRASKNRVMLRRDLARVLWRQIDSVQELTKVEENLIAKEYVERIPGKRKDSYSLRLLR